MKKALFVAVLLVAGTGVAFASSLGLPWFVDNAGTGIPLNGVAGVLGLVFLNNGTSDELTASIAYYNQEGVPLPIAGSTTFTIQGQASIAFRPVADDPVSGGGQEGEEGNAVPDRPRDIDTKKNGSLVITWAGDPSDVTGTYQQYRNNNALAFLLPAGS